MAFEQTLLNEVYNFAEVRFDADDSAPIYIGKNPTLGAATSDEGWLIYKFTYSGSNVTRIQKARGKWDERAGLFP